MSFKTITPGGTGGVVLGTAIDTSLDVLVAEVEVEKAERGNLNFIIGMVILIALIIFILIAAFRRKKK